MQLQSLTAALLLAGLTQAQTAQVLSAVVQDIKSHSLDYLSYIANGNQAPSGVLQVYQQISTYTDDSYTTLYDQVDFNAVSTFVTGLPWYSSRLAPAIGAAAAETGAGSGSESPSETAAPSSSAAEESSSAAEAPSSSAAAESSAEAPSSAEASTTASVAPSTGAANALGREGAVGYVAPVVMAMALPLLL